MIFLEAFDHTQRNIYIYIYILSLIFSTTESYILLKVLCLI